MSIAQIQAQYEALMQDHKDATKEDFLKHARGDMDASELEWRHSARLAEIADYEAHGDAYERAEATETHKEALKASRTRYLRRHALLSVLSGP